MTLSEEQAGQILDALREESPINGAVQDLGCFIIHCEDNAGKITAQNALFLAAAAKQAVTLMMAELHRLQAENNRMQAENAVLSVPLMRCTGGES